MATSIIPIFGPQTEEQPNASIVLQLPTGRLDPVLQTRRRGRLPACVPSLPTIRRKRQSIADAIAKEDAQCMVDACLRTAVRIDRGEVKGIVIVEAGRGRSARPFAAGVFQDDREFLTNALYAFGDPEFPWKVRPTPARVPTA